MKILTKKHIIETVKDRWVKQYPKELCDTSKNDILTKLESLTDITEKNINEIIGNDSWTTNTCDSCGKDSEILLSVDYYYEETPVAYICTNCIDRLNDYVKEYKNEILGS